MSLCPFMSTATSPASCTSTCKLHLNGGCAIVVNAQLLEDLKNNSEKLQKRQIDYLDAIYRIVNK